MPLIERYTVVSNAYVAAAACYQELYDHSRIDPKLNAVSLTYDTIVSMPAIAPGHRRFSMADQRRFVLSKRCGVARGCPCRHPSWTDSPMQRNGMQRMAKEKVLADEQRAQVSR
jgi:hypothetical protein